MTASEGRHDFPHLACSRASWRMYAEVWAQGMATGLTAAMPMLCRSLSFTPTGSCTPGTGSMHQAGTFSGNAFRRVNSSCNAPGGIPQSPMSGRPGSRAAFAGPMDHPMSYPASPAARTIDRRWSFSGGSQPSPYSGFGMPGQVQYCLRALERSTELCLANDMVAMSLACPAHCQFDPVMHFTFLPMQAS